MLLRQMITLLSSMTHSTVPLWVTVARFKVLLTLTMRLCSLFWYEWEPTLHQTPGAEQHAEDFKGRTDQLYSDVIAEIRVDDKHEVSYLKIDNETLNLAIQSSSPCSELSANKTSLLALPSHFPVLLQAMCVYLGNQSFLFHQEHEWPQCNWSWK